MSDDRSVWRKNLPEDFDGRFGKKFDDEISVKAVVQVSVGLAAICAVTFVLAWFMLGWFDSRSEAAQPAPAVLAEANTQQPPPGPQLQAHPEDEMEVLREETAAHLNGFGWVDEAAGSVHIPVDKAMDLLLAQAGTSSQAGEAAADGESSTAAEGDTAAVDTAADSATTAEPTPGEGGH